jgi:hypothetical protein
MQRIEVLAELAVANPLAIDRLDGFLVFPDLTENLVERLLSRIL